MFPQTYMLQNAKPHKERSPLRLLFIFIVMYFIANVIHTLILIPFISVYFVSTPAIAEQMQALIGAETDTAYSEALIKLAELIGDYPVWLVAVMLFACVAYIGVAIFCCKKIDKRPLSSMGLHRREAAADYLYGALFGLLMFSACLFICVASGEASIVFSLRSFGGTAVLWILLLMAGYMVQGLAEQLIINGYFLSSLAASTKRTVLAVLVSAFLFASFHSTSATVSYVGYINMLLFGALTALLTLRRGNIWCSAALHAFWNFAQGSIFGIYTGAMPETPSLFTSQINVTRVLFGGGEAGPEAGFAVTLLLVAGIVVLLRTKTKRSEIAETCSDA